MIDLTRRWDEPLLIESRDALTDYSTQDLHDLVQRVYEGKADEGDRRRYFTLEALPNFLESISIMRRRGLSIELIDDHWGSAIWTVWESWAPATRYLRARLDTETIYQNLELMAEEIRGRRSARPSIRAPGINPR